jgi:putative Mg2+ transporter-C (MgtC) family protein
MNSIALRPDDWLGLTFRIVLALFVGGVIGWDRQRSGKSAGLRTHMLVSLGAAFFVLTPLQVTTANFGDALSRTIQGVAAGVGFLGAGEILHFSRQDTGKLRVKGLTSAAAIWVAAALGIAAGCGFWQLCVLGTLTTGFVLSGAQKLENKVFPPHHEDGTDG